MQTSPRDLYWLPEIVDWRTRFQATAACGMASWPSLVSLANARVNFIQTVKLDKLMQSMYRDAPPPELTSKPVRLAVLGSSTTDHLVPSVRIAALRRSIWLKAYTTPYAQYLQDLLNSRSDLYEFRPDT